VQHPYPTDTKEDSDCADYLDHFVQLWLLGDYVGDPEFQNKVMEHMMDCVKDGALIKTSTVELIWEESAESSVIRTWVVDLVRHQADRLGKDILEGLPVEFLAEALARSWDDRIIPRIRRAMRSSHEERRRYLCDA